MKKPKLIVITGPTASGKSALAVETAIRLKTEIISADSRQIYRGIPIVTAVPDEQEKKGVKHHLLEKLELEEYYSASLFEEDSLSILSGLYKKSDVAVVCGGSMMYVDALCNGIDTLPTIPPEIRQQLMEEWNERGNEWLLAQLKETDPVTYENIDKNNLKRIFHALEISIVSGCPYSSLLTGKKKERPFEIFKFCLEGEREYLFSRINKRVDRMIASGLEEEARKVYEKKHLNSLNTVGLKEMFSYFEGGMDYFTAVERIKKNTRVYAKKQITWYNKDKNIIMLNMDESPDTNSSKIIEYIMKDHK